MSRKRGDGTLRIGVGAGTADDRIEPAGELAEKGELDYLVFECLAERTVARENMARSRDPDRGYTPRLLERMERVLPACREQGIRVVTNMGAANPSAAARALRNYASDVGLGELPCAVVLGDEPYEVRLRIAARSDNRRAAEAVGFEVRAMHVHGPAGGGGGSDPLVRDILAVQSILLPRELVTPEIVIEGRA
jgi:hypothetical protein